MPQIQINEITMHYEVSGDLQHGQTPIVFIHGLGSSLRDWENQLPYFKETYPIITFDLRGHGHSDKPDVPYTIKMFTHDTAQLIAKLTSHKCHIVGLSLGGMIAFQLALDYPQLVQTLTIVNSAPAVTFPSLKLFLAFYLRKLSVRLFGMKKLSPTLAHLLLPKPDQALLREKFIERWNENDPQGYLNSLDAFHRWNVMHRLLELQCPTLIVSGDRDYTPISYKDIYGKMIQHSQVVLIPDSGHLTPIDQPQAFNQALAEFLARYPT